MYRKLIILLVGLIVASALIVSTGGSPGDPASEIDTIDLVPHEPETNQYAFLIDGELEILLTDENPVLPADGVNPGAVFDLGQVFDVENHAEEDTASVWVDHDGEGVMFYVAGHGPVESLDTAIEVPPGESVPVGIRIDSRGSTPGRILDGMTVMVDLESGGEKTETTETGPESPTDGGDPTVQTSPPPEPTPTISPPAESDTPTDEPPTGTDEPVDSDTETLTSTSTVVDSQTNTGEPITDTQADEVQFIGGLGMTALGVLLFVLLLTLVALRAYRAGVD